MDRDREAHRHRRDRDIDDEKEKNIFFLAAEEIAEKSYVQRRQ